MTSRFSSSRAWRIAVCATGVAGLAAVAALSQTGGSTSTASTSTSSSTSTLLGSTTIASMSVDPDHYAQYQQALDVWRLRREKDSCSSCHGPDFFDLARIGTSDSEIVRRALMDGASEAEGRTLVDGVKAVRAIYGLGPENPRTFRPFQPGGAVLAGSSSIERDLAFAAELEQFLPTLTSAQPIASLADAKRARDEFLAVDFDTMKIGVPLPRWSSDIAHGAAEGTFNDWVSDLARVPRPERRDEFIALQDAYLIDSSDFNFWKMYFAVDEMTLPFEGITPVDPADRWKAERFSAMKYKSALIGQHALRVQSLNRTGFMKGQVAFSYLTTEEPFRTAFKGKSATHRGGERLPEFLPNPWWELGDVARFGFRPTSLTEGQPGNTGGNNYMRDTLRLLGYPQFVLDSIDPNALTLPMLEETQLSWFMLGVRLDPGLRRIAQSNSVLVGEYLQAQLHQYDYFIHRTFQTGLRTVTRTYRPEAAGYETPVYNLHFGYFTGYGRHMPSKWNSPGENRISSQMKAEQIAAYKRITANFFRMSLYLHEEELDQGRIQPYGNIPQDGDYESIHNFFNYAGLPNRSADDALIRRVAAKSNTALNF